MLKTTDKSIQRVVNLIPRHNGTMELGLTIKLMSLNSQNRRQGQEAKYNQHDNLLDFAIFLAVVAEIPDDAGKY